MPEIKALEQLLGDRKDYFNEDGALFKGVVNEKGFNSENRTANFVMSSQAVDRMGDVVVQEGMDLSNFLKNPVALAFHDHTSPVGLWNDIKSVLNGRPPRTEGTLALHSEGTTQKTDEIANLLNVNGLRASSIGFMPKDVQFIRDESGAWTGGFNISESELLECSVVSVPAHPAALMKDAGGNYKLLGEALEYILDTYCEKTAGALYVKSEYASLYRDMKGNKTVVVTSEDAPVEELSADEIAEKEAEAAAEAAAAEAAAEAEKELEIDTDDKKVSNIVQTVLKGLADMFSSGKFDEELVLPAVEKAGTEVVVKNLKKKDLEDQDDKAKKPKSKKTDPELIEGSRAAIVKKLAEIKGEAAPAE